MPGTPSCCQDGVRPCQWIRLGSSIRFFHADAEALAHLGPDAEGAVGLLDSVHRGRLAVHLDTAAMQTQHCLRFTISAPARRRRSLGTRERGHKCRGRGGRHGVKAWSGLPGKATSRNRNRAVPRLFCERGGREACGRSAAYIGCNSRAIATPAASARNDSSAITGTGGHGFSPPSMRIAGAACGVISMPAW
jgi:hypothetical protein